MLRIFLSNLNVQSIHCCRHIADNLQQRFGNKIRPLFWQAARAQTRRLFKLKMEVIQRQSKPVWEYLTVIKKTLWTTAYRAYPRYGHDTSNIIESVNPYSVLRLSEIIFFLHGPRNWSSLSTGELSSLAVGLDQNWALAVLPKHIGI